MVSSYRVPQPASTLSSLIPITFIGRDHIPDGSNYDGVGAAVVLIDGERKKVRHYHLGKWEQHAVYEAELVEIILGTQLLLEETNSVSAASIALDNQAAIRSVRSRKSGPGHYLLGVFHRLK